MKDIYTFTFNGSKNKSFFFFFLLMDPFCPIWYMFYENVSIVKMSRSGCV